MQFQNNKERILIVDFGSQVTKLIARRVRELGVYSEIITPKDKNIKDFETVKGIYFQEGLHCYKTKISKYSQTNFLKNTNLRHLYGLQLIAKLYGGKIKSSRKKENLAERIFLKNNLNLQKILNLKTLYG